MMSKDARGPPPSGLGRREVLAGAGVISLSGLAGCASVLGEEPTQVTIAGSSTVFPVTEAVASAFNERQPDVNVSISQTGTGGGFSNFFCPGMTDVNNASREVADVEEEQCADNGIEAIEFTVATDALTVVVNPEADWIDCLTVDQLEAIWRADGADRWSDIDDDWPDEPLELFGADTTSGTYDYFVEAILGEDLNHRTDYHATERDRSIVQGVRGNEHAMGYFGYAYYGENPEQIDAVAIDDGNGCVGPSIETAMNGEYTPLSRDLYIYAADRALRRQEVVDFLEFYFEQAATDLVADVGYVPITEEVRDENLEKLERAVAEVTG